MRFSPRLFSARKDKNLIMTFFFLLSFRTVMKCSTGMWKEGDRVCGMVSLVASTRPLLPSFFFPFSFSELTFASLLRSLSFSEVSLLPSSTVSSPSLSLLRFPRRFKPDPLRPPRFAEKMLDRYGMQGSCATYCRTQCDMICKVPETMSFEEACCSPCCMMMSFQVRFVSSLFVPFVRLRSLFPPSSFL